MTLVKICGITNLEDALLSVELGADMLGFNFYEKSPRYIAPRSARNIIDKIGTRARSVGVFVNEENERLLRITVDSYIDLVQFHGNEAQYALDLIRNNLGLEVIKALRIHDGLSQDPGDFGEASFLVDGYAPGRYGGTGTVADWESARLIVTKGYRVYLAGGLTGENVTDAIKHVRPYAVDVASGVESSPGKKDPSKVAAFIKAAKEAV
jgi:phosphoribosylanthranilate isomerase